MRWTVWWMGAVLWGGCAAQAADAVRVTHRTPKSACEARGHVEGRGTSVPVAQREAREAAVALGANTVVIDEPVVRLPAGRSYVSGTALYCQARGATTQEAPPVAAQQAVTAPAPANALPGVSARESAAATAVVATAAASEEAPPAAAPSPEERLRTLQDLHEKGLITQDEYDAKRQQILQQL